MTKQFILKAMYMKFIKCNISIFILIQHYVQIFMFRGLLWFSYFF